MDSSKATNFLFRQQKARKHTFSLLVLFSLGIFSTIAVIYFALSASTKQLWNPNVFWTVTVVVGGWILGASFLKMMELTAGGKSIAISLGGRELLQSTRDIGERRLLNIVEEMSIASGVSIPTVYVLDQEKSINAFAAGYKPSNAVIGVTRGALDVLNRDELQGVIGHEFSHILNGDMSLNLRITAFVFGLLALTELAYIIMHIIPARSDSENSNNSGPALVLAGFAAAAIIYVVSLVSVFFGKLIQAAVSREREHLADASAVEFTRNPMGLASALKKIGALQEHSYLSTPKAGEVAHLFFANGIKGFFGSVFKTHPPLIERIRLLDPQFDGDFSTAFRGQTKESQPHSQQTSSSKRTGNMQNFVATAALFGNTNQISDNKCENVNTPEHIVGTHVTNTLDAMSVIFSMLLDENPDIRTEQINSINLVYGKFLGQRIFRECSKYSDLNSMQKLSIATLLSPALRQMSENQFNQFQVVLKKLISADKKVDLFEFCLLKNIENTLTGYFKPKRQPTLRRDEVISSISLLFSILAHTEDCPMNEKIRAVQNAVNYLGIEGITFIQIKDYNLGILEKSLNNLYFEDKLFTENLLQACRIILQTTNGQITNDEQALLNAIRIALN